MEPTYEKELIKFKKENTKKPRYPIYFPDKLLIINNSFYNKINKLFSYEVIYFLPNKNNVNDIRSIIEHRMCLNYRHRLYNSNCFTSNGFKVSFISVCHICHHMYILSGRYNSKERYKKAFEFFKKPK